MKHRFLTALSLLLFLLLPATVTASSETGPLAHRDQRIVVVPDRNLEVEIWTDKGPRARYCVGEAIEIFFRTNRDAYVAILNTDTRGKTHRIFPNRYDREHFVEAGRTYRLPVDGYRLLVEGPPGRETLKALAATDRKTLRRASRDLLRGDYPRPVWHRSGPIEPGYLEPGAYEPEGEGDRLEAYDHSDADTATGYGSGSRSSASPPRSHPQRIVVVPDHDSAEVALDSISHRVRSGRACRWLPRYRRW